MDKRNISWLYIFSKWTVPLIVSFAFFVVGILSIVAITLMNNADAVSWGGAILLFIFGLIVFLFPVLAIGRYILAIKKGERCEAKIRFYTRSSIEDNYVGALCELKCILEGKEVCNSINISHIIMNKYCKYSIIPAFYYKGRLYPDFKSLDLKK